MSLLPRTLFPSIERAFSLLDEPLFTATRRFPSVFPTLAPPTISNRFSPSVDISETDKDYIVEAEVPGMKREDLSVEFLDDNTLVLKGKIERNRGGSAAEQEPLRKVGAGQEGGAAESTEVQAKADETTDVGQPHYWSSERVIGNFSRSFQFPGRIDPAKVKAAYKDGILSILVPKIEPRGTKISIE
ncbi:14398_t:CDS:1 [Ambispora leptoticha]|uniref:14398_t:CDS:1 n=1 Tax=Ambispora leptoticha TaxID=144679 RepID=A0A9N9DCD6_9GLOM|nr:14398_t:CDS:1 [Ambispora leptoticha]